MFEKMERIGYAIIGFCIATVIGLLVYLLTYAEKKPHKALKCAHLTERQVVLKHEKYIMFLDSLYAGKRKSTERFADSLDKYRIK